MSKMDTRTKILDVAEKLISEKEYLEGLRFVESMEFSGAHVFTYSARPGTAAAWKEPGGCGTSAACVHCGAVLAVLASQEIGEPRERECLLTIGNEGDPRSCVELLVRAQYNRNLTEVHQLQCRATFVTGIDERCGCRDQAHPAEG